MAVLIVGLVLVAIAAVGFWRKGSAAAALRYPMAIAGGILLFSLLLPSPPASPESTLANPVPLTVDSIAAGSGVYLNNCAVCHGVDARGNGSEAGTTAVRPPALTGPESHLTQHSDGDLHYWIGHGLTGGMPAWAAQLSDTQIWDVIDYLRSLNGAALAPSSTTATP